MLNDETDWSPIPSKKKYSTTNAMMASMTKNTERDHAPLSFSARRCRPCGSAVYKLPTSVTLLPHFPVEAELLITR
jgi:hypothetical protein